MKLPWTDMKVAFSINNDEKIWDAWNYGKGKMKLPNGWELIETDSSGARIVVIFRIDHIPTIEEGKLVLKQINRYDEKY